MNDLETLAMVWLGLAITAFVGCYTFTKKIQPRTRWEASAWLKAVFRSFPWAFLLTPSIGFGAIPMPMPAGLLMVGWLWGMITHVSFQEPHSPTGPIACMIFLLSWLVIFVGTLFGLRLAHEKK